MSKKNQTFSEIYKKKKLFCEFSQKTTPTHQSVGAPTYSPTSKTKTNTQLHSTYHKRTHWYFEILGLEAMEFFLGDFASDASDFDAADGNSYKDYYSDDDNLFSLDDVSHSELRDIWKA